MANPYPSGYGYPQAQGYTGYGQPMYGQPAYPMQQQTAYPQMGYGMPNPYQQQQTMYNMNYRSSQNVSAPNVQFNQAQNSATPGQSPYANNPRHTSTAPYVPTPTNMHPQSPARFIAPLMEPPRMQYIPPPPNIHSIVIDKEKMNPMSNLYTYLASIDIIDELMVEGIISSTEREQLFKKQLSLYTVASKASNNSKDMTKSQIDEFADLTGLDISFARNAIFPEKAKTETKQTTSTADAMQLGNLRTELNNVLFIVSKDVSTFSTYQMSIQSNLYNILNLAKRIYPTNVASHSTLEHWISVINKTKVMDANMAQKMQKDIHQALNF
ncbi:hypothetical protein TRFO_22738 [Tritrichomonas foetus]|uniref:Uncharacterized protein n=1 Tax=Tritrichomonas foetus TaxID=1144522 RepID=A0A1J4KB56_9EUKA|nr:hypothetical protein TRFO_22738 [Tritrichomonas foetus]|eukprot:OHT08655.1 hypothetical protein TRFO_22738 [Tritrichomonas foetus]